MPYIYVLECADETFYIGKTYRTVETRANEHFSSHGSEWTRKHKPVKILESFESNDIFAEDNYTKKYMIKHGIEKVRGGSYVQLILKEYQIKALEAEFCTLLDKCLKCHQPGHFAGYRPNGNQHTNKKQTEKHSVVETHHIVENHSEKSSHIVEKHHIVETHHIVKKEKKKNKKSESYYFIRDEL